MSHIETNIIVIQSSPLIIPPTNTDDKDETRIVSMRKSSWTSQEEPMNVATHNKTECTTQTPLLLKTMDELKRDIDNIEHKDKQNTNTPQKTRVIFTPKKPGDELGCLRRKSTS